MLSRMLAFGVSGLLQHVVQNVQNVQIKLALKHLGMTASHTNKHNKLMTIMVPGINKISETVGLESCHSMYTVYDLHCACA